MEQQAPIATVKTPEDIEREMLHTRESITEKVAALEHQVVGTVQSATNALASVKSLVSSAPEKVKESLAAVREQLDMSNYIRNHPWSVLGSSFASGLLLGYFLGGSRREYTPEPAIARPAMPQPMQSSEPGVFDELIGMVGTEAKQLLKDVIHSTSAALKQNISTGVPKFVDAAASHIQAEPAGSAV